jgi:hypothetical protein
VNCKSNRKENFADPSTLSPQWKEIYNQYGPTYLKVENDIPISFYNSKKKEYQYLRLSDFYYPGSYCSYLADSPLYGTPNLEALRLILSHYRCRIIHLDVYSDRPESIGDPNANPIVRCEEMKEKTAYLSLEDCFRVIRDNAWTSSQYPLFLYMNFNFTQNDTLYEKIYHLFLKYFSTRLMDRKYGFAGRNGNFSISQANLKDCLNNIILITNTYPTRNVLDELINSSTNDLNQDVNLYEYKESYVIYDKIGVSQDYDKNQLVQRTRTQLLFFHTIQNPKFRDPNNTKQGLFNPNFQDCGQYGIQATLMYVFVPDENFNRWYTYFMEKNNFQPILKDESLRYMSEPQIPVKQQDKILALQQPQKYCLTPGPNGITTEKSNLTDSTTNNTCNNNEAPPPPPEIKNPELDSNLREIDGLNKPEVKAKPKYVPWMFRKKGLNN